MKHIHAAAHGPPQINEHRQAMGSTRGGGRGYLLTRRANALKMNRSRKMMGSTPGLCTLTATSWPVSLSTALYTCPKEAAAMGLSEMLLNTSAIGRPSSSCKMPNACKKGVGGGLSQLDLSYISRQSCYRCGGRPQLEDCGLGRASLPGQHHSVSTMFAWSSCAATAIKASLVWH